VAVGTVRTVVVTPTVPANGVKAFSRVLALPAPHFIVSIANDTPSVDLVLFAVNGVPLPIVRRSLVVQNGDKVSVLLSNETAGVLTPTITITAQELAP